MAPDTRLKLKKTVKTTAQLSRLCDEVLYLVFLAVFNQEPRPATLPLKLLGTYRPYIRTGEE